MGQVEDVGLVEAVVREAIAPFSGNNNLQDFETPLFEGGLELDSIGFLDLVIEIEGRLGVSLRSEDLTGEAVQTIGGLVRHIAAVIPKRRATQRGTNTPA
jgi:acyl carrier protein